MSTIHMPQVKNPFHPGEILEEEFLLPKGISQSQLARALGTTHAVINEICRGKRGIEWEKQKKKVS